MISILFMTSIIMKEKKYLIAFGLMLISTVSFSQILISEEKLLYDIIMKYRKEQGLPSIPRIIPHTLINYNRVVSSAFFPRF